MRQDPSNGKMYVNEGVEIQVFNAKQAMEVFHHGQEQRRVAQTTMNTESSRAHSIFTIHLVKLQSSKDGDIHKQTSFESSQISFVDMAGSERTSRTGIYLTFICRYSLLRPTSS